jgi:hypothetical protein
MKRVIGWRRLDTVGVEYAEMESDPLRVAGDVVLVEDGRVWAVSYRVDCDDTGVTSRAVVRLKHDGLLSERTLVRRPDGVWTVDEVAIPQLAGALDVDLSVTPSTNTLPIRRLRVEPGPRVEVTAAWVMFPSLEVRPLLQSYRRKSATLYEYEAPDLDFSAQLSVDEEGIVQTYGALWARVQ